ncbi:MAG: hypothetical protein JW861_08785 [Bacteroidales bacterium]|nr:hypothetical protein [Bacteroidales bacterium]
MKTRISLFVALLGSVVVLSGCGKMPQAEVDTANLAVQAARDVQAELYVPEGFFALQDSMNVAMQMVEKQKSKVMFRSYEDARRKLEAVAVAAQQLQEQAVVQKNLVKEEVSGMITEIATLMEDNRALIVKAPRGKEGKAALEAIQAEMGVLDAGIADIQAMMGREEFIQARDKGTAIREKAMSINMELKEAIGKTRK